MLSIRLFGAPEILFDGQPLTVTRRKSRALVYYLAAHRTPRTRDHLVAFFWPDKERAAAQQILRTTLHGLHKALGPALVADEETLALSPDTQVDVRTFEQELARPSGDPERLTSTLQLYRGDFLEGFSLPDTPSFDDWAAVEQERYRRLMVRGLAALSQLREARGDYASALDALVRALAFDALQEDLQRAALRLHYLAGDRAGAIRRYEMLRKLLDQEMGVPPMAETRAVYDAIIADRLPRPAPPPAGLVLAPEERAAATRRKWAPRTPDTLPFTGRSAELALLRRASDPGTDERGRPLFLIEGATGMGKTRLADEFLRGWSGLCLCGAARELEHALPYQPVIEALRGLLADPAWPSLQQRLDLPPVWLNEMARLVPECAGGAPAPPQSADESRLWEGMNQFLLALARFQPVVFFLDDLHWADASTLALLGYLVRRAGGGRAPAAPVVFLAATRPPDLRSPLATLLQALTREGRLARVPLERLTHEDTVALARRLSPDYAYPLADWLEHTAEGNPYILGELVRHARENGVLREDGTVDLSALSASRVVPQTVYSLIQTRLARLSEPARRVLDAAVAAGRVFEFPMVARAAALSESAALDALDELRALRLVEPHGTDGLHYAFDHSLTIEVAYREVGEPRHQLMHRRMAEAIESLYGNRQNQDSVAGLLAWHLTEGGAPERAAPYAFRAGQLAANLAAWQEAIVFYEQALAEGASVDRRAVLMALGEARMQAGESAQASEAFRAALDLASSRGGDKDAARLALGQSLLMQARYAEVIALARQVIRSGSGERIAQAQLTWGTALSLEGADLAGAAEHLHEGEALLRAQGAEGIPVDPALLAHITFEQGSVAAQQGDLPQAVTRYREALSIAERSGAESAVMWRILARNNLAYHLHLMGDPSAADYAREGLSLAQEKGVLESQTYLHSTLGEIELARGDLDSAEQHFNEGLALAERLSMPERIAGLTANLGLVAQRRGQTGLAIHRLSTALARADALGIQQLATQIRLWLAPLLPPAEARDHLAEARAAAESSGRRALLDQVIRLEKEIPTA